MMRALKVLAWLTGLVIAAGLGYLLLTPRISLEPPRRAGPPALVAQNDADPQLWIVTEQEERESIGGGRHGMLPYAALRNRWQLGDRLVLFGSFPDPQADDSTHHEALAVLGLGDGVVRAWNLTLDQEVAPAVR